MRTLITSVADAVAYNKFATRKLQGSESTHAGKKRYHQVPAHLRSWIDHGSVPYGAQRCLRIPTMLPLSSSSLHYLWCDPHLTLANTSSTTSLHPARPQSNAQTPVSSHCFPPHRPNQSGPGRGGIDVQHFGVHKGPDQEGGGAGGGREALVRARHGVGHDHEHSPGGAGGAQGAQEQDAGEENTPLRACVVRQTAVRACISYDTFKFVSTRSVGNRALFGGMTQRLLSFGVMTIMDEKIVLRKTVQQAATAVPPWWTCSEFYRTKIGFAQHRGKAMVRYETPDNTCRFLAAGARCKRRSASSYHSKEKVD